MSIVTHCGGLPNDADCSYCLDTYECRLLREAICRGCVREHLCPTEVKRKKVEAGVCRGREMRE
jgi:hypothetical protein